MVKKTLKRRKKTLKRRNKTLKRRNKTFKRLTKRRTKRRIKKKVSKRTKRTKKKKYKKLSRKKYKKLRGGMEGSAAAGGAAAGGAAADIRLPIEGTCVKQGKNPMGRGFGNLASAFGQGGKVGDTRGYEFDGTLLKFAAGSKPEGEMWIVGGGKKEWGWGREGENKIKFTNDNEAKLGPSRTLMFPNETEAGRLFAALNMYSPEEPVDPTYQVAHTFLNLAGKGEWDRVMEIILSRPTIIHAQPLGVAGGPRCSALHQATGAGRGGKWPKHKNNYLQTEIIKFLMVHGADPYAKCSPAAEGREVTPLDLAVGRPYDIINVFVTQMLKPEARSRSYLPGYNKAEWTRNLEELINKYRIDLLALIINDNGMFQKGDGTQEDPNYDGKCWWPTNEPESYSYARPPVFTEWMQEFVVDHPEHKLLTQKYEAAAQQHKSHSDAEYQRGQDETDRPKALKQQEIIMQVKGTNYTLLRRAEHMKEILNKTLELEGHSEVGKVSETVYPIFVEVIGRIIHNPDNLGVLEVVLNEIIEENEYKGTDHGHHHYQNLPKNIISYYVQLEPPTPFTKGFVKVLNKYGKKTLLDSDKFQADVAKIIERREALSPSVAGVGGGASRGAGGGAGGGGAVAPATVVQAEETSLSPEAFEAYDTVKQLPNSFHQLGEQKGNGVVVSSAVDIGEDTVPLVLVNNTLHTGEGDRVPILGLEKGKINDIGSLLPVDQEIVVNFIVSDCRREILNAFDSNRLSKNNTGKTVVRQMIMLPSQLNGAEHIDIDNSSIPLYELEKSKQSITDSHWFKTYKDDQTGGPIAQLRASLEVAQEVLRISEANSEKRTETEWGNPLPINYVREVINALPEETRGTIYLKNGYLQCHTATKETAETFIQNMDKMTALMSVGNPSSGVDFFNVRGGRSEEGDKKTDMVYTSAIPVKGDYVEGKVGNERISLIGLNVIFNQYLIALSQAYELAKDLEEDQVYEVLVMPLGSGVFKNPALYALIGLREAMRIVYTKIPESKNKLDIKLLFYEGQKWSGTTDLEDILIEIEAAGFENPGIFLNPL